MLEAEPRGLRTDSLFRARERGERPDSKDRFVDCKESNLLLMNTLPQGQPEQ